MLLPGQDRSDNGKRSSAKEDTDRCYTGNGREDKCIVLEMDNLLKLVLGPLAEWLATRGAEQRIKARLDILNSLPPQSESADPLLGNIEEQIRELIDETRRSDPFRIVFGLIYLVIGGGLGFLAFTGDVGWWWALGVVSLLLGVVGVVGSWRSMNEIQMEEYSKKSHNWRMIVAVVFGLLYVAIPVVAGWYAISEDAWVGWTLGVVTLPAGSLGIYGFVSGMTREAKGSINRGPGI